MPSKKPLFSLGRVVITPGASEVFKRVEGSLLTLLVRHRTGDWGDVDDDDRKTNDLSLFHDMRLFSVYRLQEGTVWIITEADRSATTILLPEEY